MSWTNLDDELEGVRSAARGNADITLAAYVAERMSAYGGPDFNFVAEALIHAALTAREVAHRLKTPAQLADTLPWLSLHLLRRIIRNSYENGLARAIIRPSPRRVLIDTEEFDRWLDERRDAAACGDGDAWYVHGR